MNSGKISYISQFFITVFFFFLVSMLPLSADESSCGSSGAAPGGGDDRSGSFTVAHEGGNEFTDDEHGDADGNGESPPHEHSEAGDIHVHAHGHHHIHSHGNGEKDECMTCQEYWHEPWRISTYSIQWVRVKTLKILIFILLCWLYLKRKMLLSLLSGRKGSGRMK